MTFDTLIPEFDKGLRPLFAQAHSQRAHPDAGVADAELSPAEKRHALGLMRVNHCGEICAQALYQGQALTARDEAARDKLREAAQEEVEHLAWTERRIRELGGRPTLLAPLWYKWNLGFLEETEHQVGAHLDSHLRQLPEQDAKSRAIVQQMRDDELRHADMAHNFGAASLPKPIKRLMTLSAKAMTASTYRL